MLIFIDKYNLIPTKTPTAMSSSDRHLEGLAKVIAYGEYGPILAG